MAGALCRTAAVRKFHIIMVRKPIIFICRDFSTNQPTIREETGKRENVLTQKLGALVEWYEEITGMDEVRRAQNRVLDAEEKFIAAQERRREANKAVTEIQTRLKDIHAALDSTTRGEDRYVQLITQEHQILKEERKLMVEFQQLEREEREYFSMLSSAVKESHEQERAQAEKTKYWSIIGSIIGTVIGVIGSSINNSLKMKELRKLIKESATRKDDNLVRSNEMLPKYEEELSSVIGKLKTVATLSNDEMIKQLKDMVNTLSDKTKVDADKSVSSTDRVIDALNRQGGLIEKSFKELKSSLTLHPISTLELTDDRVAVVTVGLEERLQKQQHVTQLVVVGSAVLVVTVPFLVKYFGVA